MKAKNLIIAIILLFCFSSVNAQTKNPFEKLSNDKKITTVFISKGLLSLAPNMDINANGIDIKELVNKLEQLEIYTSEEKGGVQLMKTVINSFKENKTYEVLMKIKDGNENVTFYVQKDKDIFKELVMSVEDEGESTIIRMKGSFTAEDIQGLVNKEKK